jgi:hypothetical protein
MKIVKSVTTALVGAFLLLAPMGYSFAKEANVPKAETFPNKAPNGYADRYQPGQNVRAPLICKNTRYALVVMRILRLRGLPAVIQYLKMGPQMSGCMHLPRPAFGTLGKRTAITSVEGKPAGIYEMKVNRGAITVYIMMPLTKLKGKGV